VPSLVFAELRNRVEISFKINVVKKKRKSYFLDSSVFLLNLCVGIQGALGYLGLLKLTK